MYRRSPARARKNRDSGGVERVESEIQASSGGATLPVEECPTWRVNLFQHPHSHLLVAQKREEK